MGLMSRGRLSRAGLRANAARLDIWDSGKSVNELIEGVRRQLIGGRMASGGSGGVVGGILGATFVFFLLCNCVVDTGASESEHRNQNCEYLVLFTLLYDFSGNNMSFVFLR